MEGYSLRAVTEHIVADLWVKMDSVPITFMKITKYPHCEIGYVDIVGSNSVCILQSRTYAPA